MEFDEILKSADKRTKQLKYSERGSTMIASPTKRELKARRICAKLQTKLITKHKWTDKDRKRWDAIIQIIRAERTR